ncbi:MAG TPA: phosphoribosyltransferase family protein [Sulfuricaulis sp.]|nr:phosphoribosyltransferase family protein [Sulfuricaulis sp.]
MSDTAGNVFDLPEMRNRGQVFRDRTHAGNVLAWMLGAFRGTDALILAIPAGGVPVAAEVAKQLGLPLDLAVVSKITLPWSTESGYGAVAFDGTVQLNQELVAVLGLRPEVVQNGIARTKEKVERRLRQLRGDPFLPDLRHRTIILIDDGLASGFTLLTAVEAIHRLAADKMIVAIPTAHATAAARIAAKVDSLYCPNIREGMSFAVADAYEQWTDVDEATVVEIMRRFQKNH